MKKIVFSLVLFVAFAIPFLGWVAKEGNKGFLLSLLPVAAIIFFGSNWVNKNKNSLKILSCFYVLSSIGVTLILNKSNMIYTPVNAIYLCLLLIAVVVVTTLVADMATMQFWGEEDR